MEEIQRGFTRRFAYNGVLEDDPLFSAVFDDDLDRFKVAVDPARDGDNSMLIYFVVKHKRWAMFTHLIALPTFNPDSLDNLKRTPLMGLPAIPSSEAYAAALIAKGADVTWTDRAGATILHMAAREAAVDNLELARMVVEGGADIDAPNVYRETPLFVACREGNAPLVDLLVYYGADPSVPDEKRVLPIACTGAWVSPERRDHIQESLFDYTFDRGSETSLSTLVEAMTMDTPLFAKMAESVSVFYSLEDLHYFAEKLDKVKSEHLKVFLSNFNEIVVDLYQNCSLLARLIEIGLFNDLQAKEILDLFLCSNYISGMLEATDRTYSVIASLINVFNQSVDIEEITKTVLLMLSHGLHVTSYDLDTVFRYYGFCDLFRLLLYMDIAMINPDLYSYSRIYYDLNYEIEDLVVDLEQALAVLSYYNNVKLKEACLSTNDQDLVTKIKRLPDVSSLVELSRNVARKHIMKRYKIENSSKFYTILKWLPISEVYKKILALEKKLY